MFVPSRRRVDSGMPRGWSMTIVITESVFMLPGDNKRDARGEGGEEADPVTIRASDVWECL
eukprot:8029595-Pyramimonas_sp.AAC.1